MSETSVGIPWWVETLQFADDWKIPPWEILPQGKSLWIVRQRVWRDTVTKARRDKEKHDRNKGKR